MTLLGRAPIDVAVAEFEDIVSLGLQSLIEEDDSLRLIAAGIPQNRLAAALSTEATDVAILNLGSLESPSELRELHDRFPGTRLLVLADNPSPAQCRQLLGFGATACLAKSTDARDVLHAIYLASRGMHVLPADVDSDEEYETAGPTPLTPRETDVLGLLQDGSSNAEIAAALHVGVETVRTHVRNIYRKLGVSSRRELRTPG
jgi:DNA-binding NarL/FixJ family response regulator